MKRIVVAIAFAVLVVGTILILGAQFKEKTQSVPYLYHPTLEATVEGEVHIVRISKFGETVKSIHFSIDRKVLKINGIVPVYIENFEALVGMKKASVIEKYGTPHTDVGSGFSFPAYITEDAYLISFYADSEGVISRVSKEDLLGHEEKRIVWLNTEQEACSAVSLISKTWNSCLS